MYVANPILCKSGSFRTLLHHDPVFSWWRCGQVDLYGVGGICNQFAVTVDASADKDRFSVSKLRYISSLKPGRRGVVISSCRCCCFLVPRDMALNSVLPRCC